MSLIETLNRNVNKTPDEIVMALSPFLYFDTLTEEQADNYGWNRDSVLFEYYPRSSQWMLNDRSWPFWGHEDVNYFNRTLRRYACIPVEDYREGLLPDRTPNE